MADINVNVSKKVRVETEASDAKIKKYTLEKFTRAVKALPRKIRGLLQIDVRVKQISNSKFVAKVLVQIADKEIEIKEKAGNFKEAIARAEQKFLSLLRRDKNARLLKS